MLSADYYISEDRQIALKKKFLKNKKEEGEKAGDRVGEHVTHHMIAPDGEVKGAWGLISLQGGIPPVSLPWCGGRTLHRSREKEGGRE